MARNHARIYASIWADDDFRALGAGAQRMFLFLLSQPDLEHSGIIALRERRWSRSAAGMTVAEVSADLEQLSAARFIVIDEDTEELLVRSLMRWDGVWKQPNVAKAAATQIRTISSAPLREALCDELDRLAEDDLHREAEALREDLVAYLRKSSANPSLTPSLTPSGSPSRSPSATPSRGGQGKGKGNTEVGAKAGSPTPATIPVPDPLPVPLPAGAESAKPESIGQRCNRLAKIYTDRVPLSNFTAVAGIVRKAVNAHCSDEQIAIGLNKIADDSNLSLTAESLRKAIFGNDSGSSTANDRAREGIEAGRRVQAYIDQNGGGA